MNDSWATGTADGKFALTTFGDKFSDLMAHTEGELQFTLRNGSPRSGRTSRCARPFPVHLFAGNLKVKDGDVEVERGQTGIA